MGILLNRSKNYIINGAMDFWQRDTTFAAIANGDYFADRFFYGKNGTVVHTISRSTDVPTTALSNYSIFLDVTTAQASFTGANICNFSQRLEGYMLAPLKGKPITLSFWVKAFKTGTYCVFFRNGAGDRSIVKEYTINVSDTWEKKSVTITHDPSGTWDYVTGSGMQVGWTIAHGSTYQTTPDTWQSGDFRATANQVNGADNLANDFRITEIQLEEGVSSSNFERAGGNIASELQLCQRYYEKSYDVDVAPGTITSAGEFLERSDSTSSRHPVLFKVWKRTTPVCAIYASNNGAIGQWRDDTNSLNRNGSISSGVGQGGVSVFITTGGVGDQLRGHWTADAEL